MFPSKLGDWAFDPFEAFEFWVSFLPTAPMFGVAYRFEDQAPDWFAFMTAFGPRLVATESEPEIGAVEPEVAEAPPAAVTAAAVPAAGPDDLTRIKGVGPKVAARLNELGVSTFAQLAGFGSDDLAWLDENLGGIKGACIRGDWAGQARGLLAN